MNKHFRVSGSTFLKLEELGVRASAVLRRAGLPQGFIDQPRVLLKTEELFALWRAIGEVSTDPAIGLLLGTENRTERFHPIGVAALSSENFGSAIDQMARYKQLTCPEVILQEKDDEEWSIQFRWLLADEVEPPVLNDCCFAWVLRHGYAPVC
jgi:Arabinose-binding domain of AraC transcription regulator, N-term